MPQFLRPARILLLTMLLGIAPSLAQGPSASKDSLKSLSYAELGQLVRSMKGKIVIVYFWSFG